MKRLLLLLFLCGAALYGQGPTVTATNIRQIVGAPTTGCTVKGSVGKLVARNNGAAAHSTLYVCGNTAANTYAWELYGTGGGSGCSTGSTNILQKSDGAGGCTDSSVTDNGTTVTTTEPIAAPSVSTGTSPPAVTAGTGGVQASKEGTAPSVGPASGVDLCYADSTAHKLLCSLNNGSYFAMTQTIAHGSTALGTSSISSGACAAVVTATATGTLSTDTVDIVANASIKAVTGYAPSTSGGLSIVAYPSADAVSFDVCDWSASPITPGAVTINWAVRR